MEIVRLLLVLMCLIPILRLAEASDTRPVVQPHDESVGDAAAPAGDDLRLEGDAITEEAIAMLEVASQDVNDDASAVPLLERSVSLDSQDMPLRDALTEICRQAGAALVLDEQALEAAGVNLDKPVTVTFAN